MELDDIKLVANIVYRMCKEHPEICPHYYDEDKPEFSRFNSNDEWELHYVCELCGKEIVETY